MNIPQNISGLNVIFIGIITASIGTLIVQLKEYPKKLIDYAIERFTFVATVYNQDSFYKIFESWINENHKNSFSNISINNQEGRISTSHLRGTVFIKYKNKTIAILKEREKMEFSNQAIGGYLDYYTIKGWRAKNQILSLINEILENHKQESNKGKVKIFSNTYSEWYQVNALKPKSLSSIICKEEIKNNIVFDLNEFICNENWYEERNIPYKRTFLFHGIPGNGKTSLSIALALHFQKDICLLNINNIENENELRNVFSKIKPNQILLIEDCDKIFDGRESNNKVSFSGFINCMDGCFYKHGLITILTTNHIENLDAAILREGRIDRKIEIINPSSELVKNYLFDFYKSNHILIDSEVNLPMCKIQEICLVNKNDKENAINEINSYK